MADLHRVLFLLSVGLLLGLCAGMLRRGKVARSVTFSLYIGVATAFSLLYLFFPGAYTPEAFMVKQGIYDSLLFGMALEISYKAFKAFHGIAAQVRGLLAAAVTVSTIMIFALTPANQEYADIGRYQPGITTAGIWCLAFIAMLIVWYQIPVPSFTRAILLAYIPYLVVFVIVMDLVARLGWGAVQNLNVLNVAAYDLAIGYLAYAAWRKD